MAFEHDGTLKWQSPYVWSSFYIGAIALADMDNDGDVEIAAGNQLFDHLGNLLWTAPQIAGANSATAVADLDGDGALEMVLGHAAVYNDGSLMWNSGLPPGYPQVAHMDGDGLPEVVLTNANGLALLEHDGTVTDQGLRPTGAPAAGLTWTRPATIHDFDGDGQASPPVQVIRDVEDRWIQARRIWNQHTYHVTNVREDGTIPQFEPASWEQLNTSRTNAQIEGGGGCVDPLQARGPAAWRRQCSPLLRPRRVPGAR